MALVAEYISTASMDHNVNMMFQLFSEDFADDVYILNDAVESLFKKDESELRRSDDSEKKEIMMWMKAVDAVLLRHRLIEAAWETEIVSR